MGEIKETFKGSMISFSWKYQRWLEEEIRENEKYYTVGLKAKYETWREGEGIRTTLSVKKVGIVIVSKNVSRYKKVGIDKNWQKFLSLA